MSAPSQITGTDVLPAASMQRRPAWRRRLVELERGVMCGFRASGVIAVHLFCGVMGLAAGLVFGLPRLEWAILLGCFTVSLGFELTHHAFRLIARSLSLPQTTSRQVDNLTSAAATLVLCGGLSIALWLLGSRGLELWRH
ncbi:MAG: diacylglycerol kinase [Planctomyces sp.]|nr:diacylglycerol kinase [Planctomyces sp.]